MLVCISRPLTILCIFIDRELTMLLSPELPENEPKKKINDPDVSALIAGEWAAMSEEQKIEATKEHAAQMTEDRETRFTGENNSGISAFHDCRVTVGDMEEKVSL